MTDELVHPGAYYYHILSELSLDIQAWNYYIFYEIVFENLSLYEDPQHDDTFRSWEWVIFMIVVSTSWSKMKWGSKLIVHKLRPKMIGSKIMANKESIQWKDIVGVDMQNYGYTCVLTKGDTTFHFNGAISNFIELIRVWLGSILHGTPISGNSNSPEKQHRFFPQISFKLSRKEMYRNSKSKTRLLQKWPKGQGFCCISVHYLAIDWCCGLWCLKSFPFADCWIKIDWIWNSRKLFKGNELVIFFFFFFILFKRPKFNFLKHNSQLISLIVSRNII